MYMKLVSSVDLRLIMPFSIAQPVDQTSFFISVKTAEASLTAASVRTVE